MKDDDFQDFLAFAIPVTLGTLMVLSSKIIKDGALSFATGIMGFLMAGFCIYVHIAAYNVFPKLKEAVAENLSNTKNTLKSCESLLIQLSSYLNSYAKFEKSIIQAVLNGDEKARSQLLIEISSVQNKYPELKTDKILQNLICRIIDENSKMLSVIQSYNRAVANYNVESEKFIWALVPKFSNKKYPYWGDFNV